MNNLPRWTLNNSGKYSIRWHNSYIGTGADLAYHNPKVIQFVDNLVSRMEHYPDAQKVLVKYA